VVVKVVEHRFDITHFGSLFKRLAETAAAPFAQQPIVWQQQQRGLVLIETTRKVHLNEEQKGHQTKGKFSDYARKTRQMIPEQHSQAIHPCPNGISRRDKNSAADGHKFLIAINRTS